MKLKPKKKQQEESILEQNNQLLTNEPIVGNVQPKKKNKFLIGCLGIIFFLILSFILLVVVSNIFIKPGVQSVLESTESTELVSTESSTVEESTEISSESTSEVDSTEPVSNVISYDYENNLLKIGFNYDTNLYLKENTEDIFSVLKNYSDFDIYKDMLSSNLNLLSLTTGTNDKLSINIELAPSFIENLTEESYEISLESINLDDLDTNMINVLEEGGNTIDFYEPSRLEDIEGKKVLLTNISYYKGTSETRTDYTLLKQAMLPMGKNIIIVTLLSDGNPTGYDLDSLFLEIIHSITYMGDRES